MPGASWVAVHHHVATVPTTGTDIVFTIIFLLGIGGITYYLLDKWLNR